MQRSAVTWNYKVHTLLHGVMLSSSWSLGLSVARIQSSIFQTGFRPFSFIICGRGSQTILISSKNHAPDCHGKSQICTIDHMPRANTAALAGSAHTDRIHTPAVRVRVTASPSALKRIQSLNKYANVQPVSDDSSLSCTGLQCTHTARKVYPSSSSDDRVP